MRERPEYNLAATGKNLRRIRKEKKFSVEDVRRYMKFASVQAIYKWEQGQCFPTADNLLALAELYEVAPAELLVQKEHAGSKWTEEILLFLCFREEDYLVCI